MATTSQIKELFAPSADAEYKLNIGEYLKNTIFSNVWSIIFTVILVIVNILAIRAGFQAKPVGLSFFLAPNGVPTAMGNLILLVTNGALLTAIVLVWWAASGLAVIYGAARHHWPGPTQWLKDSLFSDPIGALTSLFLMLVIVFAVRGLLSWAVFGALFSTDTGTVALLRPDTPGAIWGIIGVNKKLFAVFQYPVDALWRVWASLAIIIALGALSFLAWGFGSPLKKLRGLLAWSWLASIFVILFLLRGMPDSDTGLLPGVPTNLWGGFLLTVVISVLGIVLSFPIGVVMALGRRSEVRGVPYLWVWGVALLFIYWGFGGYPTEPITMNIPILFRDPPIWIVTLSPIMFAVLQAVILIGLFWAVGNYFKGNMIKTFSILYIEIIRGVPLITVLFMANILLPLFLPREVEIDNLLRVVVGVVLFSAAYLAENVRGGLQAIPNGQYEAAMAVGLNGAKSMRLIILPQALRLVIPAIVGQCISLFKDTTLVAIVGLFDLLKVAQTVATQPDWLLLQRESYAFAALVFWIFAFAMSRASQRLERNLGVGKY